MKIGAIGIRTKIIVGDAATWYLVKKYVDGKVVGGIDDVPEELKKYVRVLGSWVDVTEDLASIENKVDKVENYSLVPDSEIDKLAGIEENANDYTHPLTHPASILDVVDAVDGSVNKFLNERGEMKQPTHAALTDKNSEAAFQHVDTTVTKTTLSENDKVALYDSETGKVVLSTALNDIETILASI